MTSNEAVQLLISRFPSLIERFGTEELFDLAPPYHAYECFANETRRRIADDAFIGRACEFINELAESDDPMLDEAIHVATLENLGSDPLASKRIKKCLRQAALQRLLAIERELYGRTGADGP